MYPHERSLENADERRMQSLQSFYGRQTVEVLRTASAKKLEAQAEQYFEKIVKSAEFADIPYQGKTLGAAASRNLFEIRNLSIGKVAPEIDGEDIDGNSMKLSDYRGKVVVLDFWGDW